MGKKYCNIGHKWCKLFQKGICKVSNTKLEDIDKCPRIAAIETTTLYAILREVNFKDVFKRLCLHFKDQEDGEEVYEGVFNELLKKKLDGHYNLNDLFINIENVKEEDDGTEWLDVTGVNVNTRQHYGIEFCKWSDWVSMFITQETLDAFSKEDIVAACLYEMTFFGFTEETVMDEKDKLEKSVEEAKKALKNEKK
jgi:hypothetical protein